MLWVILGQAYVPVDSAIQQLRDELDGVGPFLAMAGVFFGGLLLGFGGLVGYERWRRREHAGQASRTESVEPLLPDPGARLTRLGLLIAAAIGLYNLATGLALGATRGGVSPLTLLLTVGLVLTNALGGFSAAAPLATAETARPGWGLLTWMGLIGGTPLVIGTLASATLIDSTQDAFLRAVDPWNVPDLVRVGLLALAGGAIVYALAQLVMLVGQRARGGSFHAGVIAAVVFGFAAYMLMTLGGLGD